MQKTGIEGNPFENGGKPDLRNARPPRFPHHGNQSRPRMNGDVYHRSGPNYRGNGRGFGRNNRRNFPRENHHYSPSHNYDDYPPWNDPPFIQPVQRYRRPLNQPFQQGPGPSRMEPGAPPFIPHQNEIHHLPHPGNGNYAPPGNRYNGYPVHSDDGNHAPPGNGYNGQPVHNGDFNGPPSPYMAPATEDPRHNSGNPEPIPVSHQGPNSGPLIVHSQPQFNPLELRGYPPHSNGPVPHMIPDGPMNGFMSTPTMCNPNYPPGHVFNIPPSPNMAGNMQPFNPYAPEQQYQQNPRPAPWMVPIHEWSPPPEFFPNIATEPPVRHTPPNRIVEITSDQEKHALENEKLASDQETAVASSDKAKSNEDRASQTENKSDEAQAPNGKKENETEKQEGEEKESIEPTESIQSPQNGDNNKEDSGEDTLTEMEVEEGKTPDKDGAVNKSSNDSKSQEHTSTTNGKETNGKEEKKNGDGKKEEKGLADMIQEIYITTRVNEEEKFSSPSVEQKYLAEIAKELEEERKLKATKEKEEKETEEKKKKDLLKSPKLVTT